MYESNHGDDTIFFNTADSVRGELTVSVQVNRDLYFDQDDDIETWLASLFDCDDPSDVNSDSYIESTMNDSLHSNDNWNDAICSNGYVQGSASGQPPFDPSLPAVHNVQDTANAHRRSPPPGVIDKPNYPEDNDDERDRMRAFSESSNHSLNQSSTIRNNYLSPGSSVITEGNSNDFKYLCSKENVIVLGLKVATNPPGVTSEYRHFKRDKMKKRQTVTQEQLQHWVFPEFIDYLHFKRKCLNVTNIDDLYFFQKEKNQSSYRRLLNHERDSAIIRDIQVNNIGRNKSRTSFGTSKLEKLLSDARLQLEHAPSDMEGEILHLFQLMLNNMESIAPQKESTTEMFQQIFNKNFKWFIQGSNTKDRKKRKINSKLTRDPIEGERNKDRSRKKRTGDHAYFRGRTCGTIVSNSGDSLCSTFDACTETTQYADIQSPLNWDVGVVPFSKKDVVSDDIDHLMTTDISDTDEDERDEMDFDDDDDDVAHDMYVDNMSIFGNEKHCGLAWSKCDDGAKYKINHSQSCRPV